MSNVLVVIIVFIGKWLFVPLWGGALFAVGCIVWLFIKLLQSFTSILSSDKNGPGEEEKTSYTVLLVSILVGIVISLLSLACTRLFAWYLVWNISR